MKRQFITLLCLLLLTSGYGQTVRNRNNKTDKEFYITVSAGPSFLGPVKNIEDYIRSNGFDDTSPANMFGGPVDHPKTSNYPGFNLQCIYFLNRKTGFTLNYGLINNIEVLGYQASGFGNYVFIRSKLRLISLAYTYQTTNKMHSFSFGPAVIIHSSFDESAGNNSAKNNNLKPGVQVGYSPRLYSRETWFIALDSHCNLSPKSQIGPFDGGEAATLPSVKVNTVSVYVGLAIGLRLFKE